MDLSKMMWLIFIKAFVGKHHSLLLYRLCICNNNR